MTLNLEHICNIASNLLSEAGFYSKNLHATPIYQGGNNQLFRINNGEKDFVLKKYFSNRNDLRNRLENEYKFLDFTRRLTKPLTPMPLGINLIEGVALYEFIDGDKLNLSMSIQLDIINQAAEFIYLLNKNKLTKKSNFSDASEACFSIQSHIDLIDTRLNSLKNTRSKKHEFHTLLADIIETWIRVKSKVYESCLQTSIEVDKEISLNMRILSPSDFGFHNALIRKNGTLAFIDFEYAGVDDPAKLVCDFFNQIQIPAEKKFFDSFVGTAFRNRDDLQSITTRSKILMDAYSIKWCTIALNIFIADNLERRIFSNPNLDLNYIFQTQIYKARQILNGLTE